jgi:hypothetical protein
LGPAETASPAPKADPAAGQGGCDEGIDTAAQTAPNASDLERGAEEFKETAGNLKSARCPVSNSGACLRTEDGDPECGGACPFTAAGQSDQLAAVQADYENLRAAVRAYADELYNAPLKIDACGVREHLLAMTGPPAVTVTFEGLRELDRQREAEREAEERDAEPHRCGNCSGIDPDTCLMNPDRGGPVDLRTAVYRILNVETEFIGCPSATTDRIMAEVQAARDRELRQARTYPISSHPYQGEGPGHPCTAHGYGVVCGEQWEDHTSGQRTTPLLSDEELRGGFWPGMTGGLCTPCHLSVVRVGHPDPDHPECVAKHRENEEATDG